MTLKNKCNAVSENAHNPVLEDKYDSIISVNQEFVDREVDRVEKRYDEKKSLTSFELEVVRAARYWKKHGRKMTPFHYCYLREQMKA